MRLRSSSARKKYHQRSDVAALMPASARHDVPAIAFFAIWYHPTVPYTVSCHAATDNGGGGQTKEDDTCRIRSSKVAQHNSTVVSSSQWRC
jgi:hypothetical protein